MGSFTDSCAAFRWPGPMTHSEGDGAAGGAPKRATMRPLPGDRCSSSVRSRRLLAQGRQPGVGGLDIETAYDQRALPRDPSGDAVKTTTAYRATSGAATPFLPPSNLSRRRRSMSFLPGSRCPLTCSPCSTSPRRPIPSSGTPPLRSVKASTSRSIRQRRPLRPPRGKRIYERFHRTAPGADAAFAGMGETRGFPDRPAYSSSGAAAERGRRGWIWTVQSARKAEG